MRTTSATWDALHESDTGILETKAVINGAEYTDISAPVITRAAMQDAMSVGNVISASCVFAIRTTDAIPKAARVEIYSRYNDEQTQSEWLAMGTFFISKRQRDPVSGVIALECYDSLLKSNSLMDDETPLVDENGTVITDEDNQPVTLADSDNTLDMKTLAENIAYTIGVEIDARTTIREGAIYTVTVAASATMRDVLSQIAAANAGNWIVTPENKLRLVPVVSSANAGSATTNVAEVAAVVGGLQVGDERTVTGVQYTYGDEAIPVLIGDDTGFVMNVTLPYAQANALSQIVIGMTYRPYTFTNCRYNPAAEIGDYIRYGETAAGVLWSEVDTYNVVMSADASAPDFGEIEDEYPYVGMGQKTLIDAKAYALEKAQEATAALDDSLQQEEIFNRLTNNGAEQGLILYNGKVYLNASYISAGTISANTIKGGTLTLGGANNVNGLLQVLNSSGNVIGTWDRNGISLRNGSIYFPLPNYQEGSYVALNYDQSPFVANVKASATVAACKTSIENYGMRIEYDNSQRIDISPTQVSLNGNYTSERQPRVEVSNDSTSDRALIDPTGFYITKDGGYHGYFSDTLIYTSGNLDVDGESWLGDIMSGTWRGTAIEAAYIGNHSTDKLTSGTLGAARGGTGQSTYTIGDILYCSAANTLSKLSGNTTTTRKFLRSVASTAGTAVAPAWDTVTKADVGLSNVENTKLSTWAGSSNITTVGTISSGTWQGTPIAAAYIGAHTHSYLPLSGGTMTGTLKLKGSLYKASGGGMDCQNADIIGVNCLFTSDKADSFGEGIRFYVDGSVWDTVTAANGNFYFGASRDGESLTAANSTANIYAARFYGAVTGNVTGNCTGSSGSCTGNAATATRAGYLLARAALTKGTNPSSTTYYMGSWGLESGTGTAVGNRLGGIEGSVDANGVSSFYIRAYNYTASSTGSNSLGVKIAKDGTCEYIITSPANFKTALSLNNVENTALSTWAGTANITKVGTITTGTWHGTAIEATYIGNHSTDKLTSGTLGVARGGTGAATAGPNKVFAGPSSGSASAAPSFRALAAADIPSIGAGKVTSGTFTSARMIKEKTFTGMTANSNGNWAITGLTLSNAIVVSVYLTSTTNRVPVPWVYYASASSVGQWEIKFLNASGLAIVTGDIAGTLHVLYMEP